MVGGIRRLAPTGGGRAALVLVATGWPDGDVEVVLLSPDVEFGGSQDILLDRGDTGLVYALIAETDVFGYVDPARLGRELARVDVATISAAHALRYGEVADRPAAGPPVWSRADPRWVWKLAELERLVEAIG